MERQFQIAKDWYDREIKSLGMPLDALDSDTGYSAFKGDHVKAGRGLGDFLIEIKEGRIGKGSILICDADLLTQKKTLFSQIEEAREKCAALYGKEELLDLIRQNSPGANEVRLRLRNEIRRRIMRIEFTWRENGPKFARIIFVNGADKGIAFSGEDAILCQQVSFERPEIVPV